MAKTMKLTADENMDKRMTCLLPNLSDRRPRIGENMNCIRENEPIRIPSAMAPASTVSGWKGRRGITIPKPIMSINVVMKITKDGEILNLVCLLSSCSVSFMLVDSFKRKHPSCL